MIITCDVVSGSLSESFGGVRVSGSGSFYVAQ